MHEAHLTGRVSCPELLCEALQNVTTEYVVRMDGDTVSHEDPGGLSRLHDLPAPTSAASRSLCLAGSR